MPLTLLDRYRGSLLGLACGDAVGTTVEFMPRDTFTPLTDMVGGGPFSLKPGQWTDDTSMALCLAESLLRKGGFDAADQMGRYLNWWKWGYMSSTGDCFDIGTTVRSALTAFETHGDPFAGSTDPFCAGNGSLMRLAPIVLFYFPDVQHVDDFSRQSSRTTHGAQEAIECCVVLARAISNALSGATKEQMLSVSRAGISAPKVVAIAQGDYCSKRLAQITGSGYAVASLEAALWCVLQTDSFADAVLAAANLGDDADTTAAIVGQLAGAHYGEQGIPQAWLEKLCMRDDIEEMADALFKASTKNRVTIS
ncbi:ADP-ribosylglycohydrolase [Pseudomonas sp. NS1(2017)]|uniref:ADP-ribosylglycohydrolase family protein n=1 Tax=Pseudomonas sp. NS1(2017) TaxID=2025658 RepID=UPI000BA23275|nr:ADP-ribosylglycohydrolase family protein [Pseudomonas sp. NS1(2017)]ASV38977.1 ADP-ribosylglycohydrolase [Pseudomonas sp. NS1(2017)]